MIDYAASHAETPAAASLGRRSLLMTRLHRGKRTLARREDIVEPGRCALYPLQRGVVKTSVIVERDGLNCSPRRNTISMGLVSFSASTIAFFNAFAE